MRKFLPVFILFVFVLSCEKTTVNGVTLIGKWYLITGCDSCAIFEFEDDGILKVSVIYDDEPTIFNYQVYRNNTVEISGSIDDGIYEIITHSVDTIEIMDFSLSGYPEYRNTKLKRMYDTK